MKTRFMSQPRVPSRAVRNVRYYVRMIKLARSPQTVAHYATLLQLALASEDSL